MLLLEGGKAFIASTGLNLVIFKDARKAVNSVTITVTPKSKKLDAGATAQFKVTTSGATGTVKYLWQYSTDYGTTWKNTTSAYTGYNKNTLSVVANTVRYGLLFRCMITAGNGKASSDTVYIAPTNASDFKYTDNGNNQWIISGYKGTNTVVTIPAGHLGKPAVAIGDNAFKGTGITKIVIPKSVVSIGESAFEGCTKLTTVTLSDYIKTIGRAAFKNCSKLTQMKISNK